VIAGKDQAVREAGLLTAARACYGTLLLAAPRRMIGLVAPGRASSGAVTVIRVLGARHLAQAALTAGALSGIASPAGTLPAGTLPAGTLPAGTLPAGTLPAGTLPARTLPARTLSAGITPRTVLLAGAAVDTVHAASMVALALTARRLRRATLADAALEAGLASFGIMIFRSPSPGGAAIPSRHSAHAPPGLPRR
jgi:hypothetical protein